MAEHAPNCHLFLVHSHATYHCALGVMEAEGLAPGACVMVLSRGFRCGDLPPGARTATLSRIGEPNLNTARRIARGRLDLPTRDAEVSSLTGDKAFHCYLPHTYFDFAHLLVTHRRCAEFSYLEEGLTSYYRPGEIDKAYPPWRFTARARALRRLLFGDRLPEATGFFREGYRTAYGCGAEAFPGWPRTKTLGLRHLLPPSPAGERPAHPPMLIFDALVELGRTSAAALAAAIDEFLTRLAAAGVRELCYKYHPTQSADGSIRAVDEVFARHQPRLRAVGLESGVALEELFARTRVDLYVFNSAAGLYGALAGQRVVSLNPLLERIDPPYARTTAVLPDIYHDLVKGIDRNGDLP